LDRLRKKVDRAEAEADALAELSSASDRGGGDSLGPPGACDPAEIDDHLASLKPALEISD